MSIESPQNALAKIALDTGLARLRAEADALAVTDQQGYIEACNIKIAATNYCKDVEGKLNPGIHSAMEHLRSAMEHLDTLRRQRDDYTRPAEQIALIVVKKASDWKAEERRKAEVEQERINAENRRQQQQKAEEDRIEAERVAKEQKQQKVADIKARLRAGVIGKREAARLLKLAGAYQEAAFEAAAAQAEETAAAPPPTVTVKPSVPIVAGIRQRVNWKFRIKDISRIPRLYMQANESLIGSVVRRLKSKQAAETEIPGIEAYSEDAI